MAQPYPIGINMALAIQDAEGEQCPVCKTGVIEADKAKIGYRLEPSARNLDELGITVIFHNMNTVACCCPSCAARVAPSWSGEARKGIRDELVAKIQEDIKKFLSAMEGHYGYNGMDKVKRLTKAEYKEQFDRARANGTLIKA